jgi:hemerythrin-like domain-containing protein
MNPISELTAEHRAIESALAILADISPAIGLPERPEALPDAARLVEFFSTFADACHHGKEEGFLFPALEQIGVSRKAGPIGVMLAEHDLGRRYLAAMRDNLSKMNAGRLAAAADFRKNAAQYIDLLRQHIYKEDQVLFKIAAQSLSQEMLAGICIDFERLEREKIGSGKHEAYHRLLGELREKYWTSLAKTADCLI